MGCGVNFNEAEGLLTRMNQTWRVPFGHEWESVFETMDAGRAGTAFVRLRDTEERAPTIAKFKAAYEAVRGPTVHEPRCPVCDGTGRRAPDGDHEYGSTSPACDVCDMGKLQAQREVEAAAAPIHKHRLTPGECDNGIAWAQMLRAQLRDQSGRVNARRWGA